MLDRVYRTLPGDTIRDPFTGQVFEIVSVWRAEDIDQFVDGRCYRQYGATERSVLHDTGKRRGPLPPHF